MTSKQWYNVLKHIELKKKHFWGNSVNVINPNMFFFFFCSVISYFSMFLFASHLNACCHFRGKKHLLLMLRAHSTKHFRKSQTQANINTQTLNTKYAAYWSRQALPHLKHAYFVELHTGEQTHPSVTRSTVPLETIWMFVCCKQSQHK